MEDHWVPYLAVILNHSTSWTSLLFSGQSLHFLNFLIHWNNMSRRTLLKSNDVSKRSVDPCYCISYSIPLHHQVEEEFNVSHQKECPIAAVIVEPIQAEGGESDIEFHDVRLLSPTSSQEMFTLPQNSLEDYKHSVRK